jgi:hypothetical protein
LSLHRHLVLAFDGTDITPELYVDPSTYTWSGDVNLSVIGGHDPKKLEGRFVKLMTAMDVAQEKDELDFEALNEAVVHLESQEWLAVKNEEEAINKAREKIQIFTRRNAKAGNKEVMKEARRVAAKASKPPSAALTLAAPRCHHPHCPLAQAQAQAPGLDLGPSLRLRCRLK